MGLLDYCCCCCCWLIVVCDSISFRSLSHFRFFFSSHVNWVPVIWQQSICQFTDFLWQNHRRCRSRNESILSVCFASPIDICFICCCNKLLWIHKVCHCIVKCVCVSQSCFSSKFKKEKPKAVEKVLWIDCVMCVRVWGLCQPHCAKCLQNFPLASEKSQNKRIEFKCFLFFLAAVIHRLLLLHAYCTQCMRFGR